MSDTSLSTTNSNPDWKSYSQTNDADDIITATDFNEEFSIKVDQNNGYSLNQNLVGCSIDNTSALRGLSKTITVNDLVNFYNTNSSVSGSWSPVIKITSSLAANTVYTSSGNYILSNNILYYWGSISITDLGIVEGVITNGTVDFDLIYSTTNVAANGIGSTGGTGTGATFNITSKNVYKVTSLALNLVGSGYSLNDILTITTAGTATVTGVTSNGVITGQSYILNTTPTQTDVAGTNLPSTGGTGTGATFNITSQGETLYTPSSITLNDGGSGYAVNDTISLTNIGTVTVTAIGTGGVITTVSSILSNIEQTSNMAGSAVTGQTSGSGKNATFTVTSTSGTYYVPSSATIDSKGTGYVSGDTLTVKTSDNYVIVTVNVFSVTEKGQITSVTIDLNDAYQDNNVSGNNISSTGGTGTGATFDVTTSLYYTYDQMIIDNGGYNYTTNDVLTIENYGKFTVSSTQNSNGSINITGLPYQAVSKFSYPVDITYFNGFNNSNILYMAVNINYIYFYSDQKNTQISTSDINTNFTLNFSGWFPIVTS